MTGTNLEPVDRETLRKVIFAGLATGLVGMAALLFADVEPTIDFFIVMGAAVGILSSIIDNQRVSTGGTESGPTFG